YLTRLVAGRKESADLSSLCVRALPDLREVLLGGEDALREQDPGRQRLALRHVLVDQPERGVSHIVRALAQRPGNPSLSDKVEGLWQPVVPCDEDLVVAVLLDDLTPVLRVRGAHSVDYPDIALRRVNVLD